MNNNDTTISMASPPISSLSNLKPQETQLRRGAFEPPLAPGTLGKLERFDILRLQGEGGMGQVYLAREPLTDVQVAIKIIRPELASDPQSVHRFLTEARHMYRLSHPRILRVLEVSDRKEGPYYVMPYIDGGSLLGQYGPGHTLSSERILSIAGQVADALTHAHNHGIIHRDLKPGNILLDKDGNAYLTDFGLVRTVFNDSLVDAASSHLEGTAPYMSPAVARGEAEDTRCDIYAFGALLYELLAGQPPYAGRTPQIILDHVLKGPPPPIRTVNPKASPALAKIAEGCMARELRDRYATMADVVADLDRVAAGKLPLGPHGRQHRLPRLASLLVAMFTAFGLTIGAAHWLWTHTVFATSRMHSIKRQVSSVHTQRNTSDLCPVLMTEASISTTGGLYLVVDLSGKAGATNYPVTYLDEVPAGGWTDEYKTDKLVLRRLEPGVFNMGSPEGELGHRYIEAQHQVTLTHPFYIGVFEVTQKQWEYVCETWPSYFSNVTYRVSRPVENVSYNDIRGKRTGALWPMTNSVDGFSFMGILRTRTGMPFDLPTEAQWEYACRAGTLTALNSGLNLTAIALDKNMDAVGCYGSDSKNVGRSGPPSRDCSSEEATAKVGLYQPNAWGLYDMHGNVWEWCLDWQGDYQNTGIDPQGVMTGSSRVIRGGGYSFDAEACRAASKHAYTPGLHKTYTGFRVVLNVPNDKINVRDNQRAGQLTTTCNPEKTLIYDIKHCAITINKYIGSGGDVQIPSSIDGFPVVAIGDQAFAQCATLAQIRFPASVTNIGDHAFEHCTNLASVAFPPDSKLTRIGDWAFHHCVKLPDPALPAGLGTIGDRAFSCCFGFTHVEIPARLSSIGEHAFHNCGYIASFHVDEANAAYCSADGVLFDKSMKTLIRYPPDKKGSYAIPPGVTCVGAWAFYKCDGLPRLAIPASVTDLGDASLSSCPCLSAILVDDGNPFFRSVDGVLYDKGMTTLLAFPGGGPENVDIPAGVRMIDALAFEDNHRLSRVTLPDSITSVKGAAFRRCPRLSDVVFKGPPPSLGNDVFAESEQATISHLPGQPGWGNTFGGRPTAEREPQ